MSSLRIALAQCRQTADFDANAATIFRMVDEAARQGVQILCFPETQTVGYRVDISTPDRPVPVERLAELAGSPGEAVRGARHGVRPRDRDAARGEPRRGKPYNSALVVSEAGRCSACTTRRGSRPSTPSPIRPAAASRRSSCSASGSAW